MRVLSPATLFPWPEIMVYLILHRYPILQHYCREVQTHPRTGKGHQSVFHEGPIEGFFYVILILFPLTIPILNNVLFIPRHYSESSCRSIDSYHEVDNRSLDCKVANHERINLSRFVDASIFICSQGPFFFARQIIRHLPWTEQIIGTLPTVT